MSLRDLAQAEVRRDGRKPVLHTWLATLDPELRAEVIDLLNSDIGGAAVWRTLRDHCGYKGSEGTVHKYRRGDYAESP